MLISFLRRFAVPVSAALVLAGSGLAAPPVPAFPGAEGFGAGTPGGRGGRVYIVTTLADRGPGSLREAINADGPRIVVFAVSGTIRLQSVLKILNPFITIAGQTAPGDGICLADRRIEIATHDVIIRHIRSRLGDESRQESDSFSLVNARNVMVDHCSASWSVDETLSVDGSDDVTVQWCLIAESLNHSIHSKGDHGYGSLLRGGMGSKYSFHHNLWAHHRSRMPRPGNYADYKLDPVGLLCDFRNNVFYNWMGTRGGYNDDTNSISKYNFINNYYKSGPNSTGDFAFRESCPYSQAYFAGNFMNGAEPADPWSLVILNGRLPDYKRTAPFLCAPVTTQSAPEAYESVLAKVGAFPRDPVDLRVIADVKNGTGGIIDSQAQVGGWPELRTGPAPSDRDRDGMPDEWEIRRGLNPDDPADAAGDRDGDGYTNVEEYLNSIA